MTRPPASRRLRSAIFHALRLPFRALPISDGRRDAMRNWFLDRFPRVRPLAPQGQSPSGLVLERRPRVHSGERAIGYVEYSEEPLPDPLPATLVAFYLPQFHTIPENDEWWGKGFTEWRNVARALPQFEGHLQPRLPGDLGFYDLRNPQVLRDQAKLAQTYGISAFCMYFYWFGGKTLLELPHQQWLDDPSITLPICICWANENWTRTWDGRGDEILIAQDHSPEDDLAFIAHVAQYLRDPRYLRQDGKPMLLVYRPGLLPDARATADRWRNWCRDNGIGEIHLSYVQSFERPDPRDIGFDAAVEFPPNLSTATNITDRQVLLNPDYRGEVLDWRDVAHDFATRPLPAYPLFPGVNCGWDNEARRPGRGRSFRYYSPLAYAKWLRHVIHERRDETAIGDRKIFINAWNEWAEGAALEPTSSNGHAVLDATRNALFERPGPALVAIVHAYHLDAFDDIIARLDSSDSDWHLVVTTSGERVAEVERRMRVSRFAWEIRIHPNRGRDLIPFLVEAGRLAMRGHGAVLKLHSKMSPHLKDGPRWRRALVDTLISGENISWVGAREASGQLGIAAPAASFLNLDEAGPNRRALEELAHRCGVLLEGSSTFPAGSMFWCDVQSLGDVRDHILLAEIDPEPLQADGTMLHAIERFLPSYVAGAGKKPTQSLPHHPVASSDFSYATDHSSP